MATVSGIEVVFRPANTDFSTRWLDFDPSTKILPAGWSKENGRRALTEDIAFEKDTPVKLRDGVTIFTDIFRPAKISEPVPAIIAWSPYGKEAFQALDRVPYRAGVPKDATSDLEKFEALDPAEWCPRGYAIVNVDPRGTYDSEGDIRVFGSQEGRDGYDFVEFIGQQEWCNGAVALAGNSWLGIAQWFIAAEKPPHLKAIAPWEGMSDSYREHNCRGGIPYPAFFDYRSYGYCGKNGLEDTSAMLAKYPLLNEYWKDKRARVEDIDIPMYVLASYSTCLHTEGSFRGFLQSASRQKWLRVHDTQEWYDLYQPWAINDLQKFFDRYLKGIDNGWESTPRVRHSLLGFNQSSVVNRPDSKYPPTNVELTTLYLNSIDGKIQTNKPPSNCTTEYESDSWDDDGAYFTYTFNEYMELVGYSKATLYMSCPSTDDLDVYVVIRKLDINGKPLLHLNFPITIFPAGTTPEKVPDLNIFKYVGPNGRLRASHRREGKPTPGYEAGFAADPLVRSTTVWRSHDREEKISPGQIVRLDIPLWPTGIRFQQGEAIRLEVKGHEPCLPEFPQLCRVGDTLNRGKHIIHTGPEYPSSVLLPFGKET